MWKDLFNKGKCLVGMHQGEWTFEKEKDCTRIRICIKCATESRKVEHNLGEWAYVIDGDCDQQQTCLRCELATHREVHEWQEPVLKSADACEQVSVCGRCNAEQDAPASHLWAEWEYVSADTCRQTQTCERCGSPSKERTEHLWGDWYHSEQYGGAVHVCRRCGELARSVGSQILSIISSLSNAAQANAPRQLEAPGASQAEPAGEDRAEMFERLKREANKLDDTQDATSLTELEAMHATLAKQYAEIEAQVNRIKAQGAVPPNVEAMRAAIAKQYDEITAQLNRLKSAPTRAEAVKAEEARQFEQLKKALDRITQAGAGSAKPQVERDARLVGQWRFTASDPFGVTDYHRVLKADGSFADTSHQSNGRRSGPEPGKWRTGDQTLYLNYADGRSIQFQYQLDGNNTLFFPGARLQRIWERVR